MSTKKLIKSDEKIIQIKVLTYNLSWASQKNIIAGSEADFVERCQELGRDCFQEAKKLIDKLNKAHTFDIIGIQEAEHPTLVQDIVSITELKGIYRYATWHNTVNVYAGGAIFWNTNKLGKMKHCKTINLAPIDDNGNYTDSRPCGIVTTDKDINIIVAHFAWFDNRKYIQYVQTLFNHHISNNGPIIILADTNDSETLISHENPLIIKNRNLSYGLSKNDAKTKLKSCCWHKTKQQSSTGVPYSGYKHFNTTGDYILSEHVQDIKLAINSPSNALSVKDLYSDHLPVIATVVINVPHIIKTVLSRSSTLKKIKSAPTLMKRISYKISSKL
jgi:endonuclease/exonuclease/phosphatase family metal-dependent hydrolase